MNDPIAKLYDALSAGSAAEARKAFSPDAVSWHSFDQQEQDLDTVIASFEQLIANSAARGIADIHRIEIPGGVVQEHAFWMETQGGVRMAWPVCLVVRIEDGLIARINEYMDRAGRYSPGEDVVQVPGRG